MRTRQITLPGRRWVSFMAFRRGLNVAEFTARIERIGGYVSASAFGRGVTVTIMWKGGK